LPMAVHYKLFFINYVIVHAYNIIHDELTSEDCQVVYCHLCWHIPTGEQWPRLHPNDLHPISLHIIILL
ncbi:hypothetical protein L9F63_002537, partial [Diploptera punctata]